MGANTSVQNIDSLTKSVNTALTSISATVDNNSSSNQMSNQRMSLNLSNIKGCSPNIQQIVTMSAANVLNAKSNVAAELKNQLQNVIEKQIDNATEQINKDLNIGQLNTSIQRTNSKSETINNLKNIIETGIENSVTTNQNNVQVMDIIAKDVKCGPNGLFKVTQKMVMDTISKNIAENIVNTTISNSLSNEVKELLSNESKQKNIGLNIAFGFILVVLIGVFGVGIFMYIRTRGIARAAEKRIKDYPNPPPYHAMLFGGNSKKDKYKFKLRLSLSLIALASLLTGVSIYGYITLKKKIYDMYDISYLNNN